jgi:hypothetical protein
LDILYVQLGDIEDREVKQRDVQRAWNEFTVVLRDDLDLIATNTTSIFHDVLSGLLRIQSFTRDSTRFVAQEIQGLEKEVRAVRNEIQHAQDTIDELANSGIAGIRDLGEHTLVQISMVPSSQR